MIEQPTSRRVAPTVDDLVLDIVATLRAEGVDDERLVLQEYVDVEALERVLDSDAEDPMVVLTIADVRLAVTQEGAEVLGHVE